MNSPVVTIILFAHAPYAKFLPVSLNSIVNQSYSSLEVIVLSDGSTEIRQVVDTFRGDGRVRLRSQGNQPFLLTANDLMKNAAGKYIGTWNSDDIYNEDHVRVLVGALEESPDAGGAFDNLQYFTETRTGDIADLELIVSKEQAALLAAASEVTVQQIFDENIMTGPSSLIGKAAFDKVGGYSPNIYLNCDLHWFYRIGAYFRFRFVDYIGIRKRIHAGNNTARNPHYIYGAKELEDIKINYPDVYARIGPQLFDKKLGRKYFRLGRYYENTGEKLKAREMYKKAMTLRKLSFRYHWEFLRSSVISGIM
jgi:glycosyltransferase involved in cell wall biosynthesis